MTITNARIVTRNEVFLGSVCVRDGVISSVSRKMPRSRSMLDLEGDYLIPGLVELHTDNLEKHIRPRPGVHWPALSAVGAHDSQLISSGITTVLDAVAAGDVHGDSARVRHFREMIDAVRHARRSHMCRADHYIHVRCEVSYEHVLDMFAMCIDDPLVKLVSVMDHTPGQRQFVDEDVYRTYYKGRYGLDDRAVDAMIEGQKAAHATFSMRHRRMVVAACRERQVPLASHDDACVGHVQEAVAEGIVIAEFPTTLEAAEAAHNHGLDVLMGAPNVVLGGSHSGNVSATTLAENGYLDILSSDYVPVSLLYGAFILAADPNEDLAAAIRRVSVEPAERVGFDDRGEIAPGKRADLLRVRDGAGGVPVVLTVWSRGERVA